MEPIIYQVDAFWDKDASVWVATSEDVPGLATEAGTVEALNQKLRDLIPDLLLLNHVISANHAGAIAVQITSHWQELIEVAASLTLALKKLLAEAGCFFERQGKGDHEIWYSPVTER